MFIKTVSTTSGINPIKFDETGGVFYWILNTGLSTVYASTKSTFTAGDDGVVSLGPKESRRLETNNDTIYILGAGQVEIHNQRDGICSFKQAPTSSGSGGGGAIDAYSKTESDARYAMKTDVPDSYTKNESDTKYAQKTDMPDAYTKTESDAKYAAKSDVPDTYTKTESDDKYAQKTDVVPYKMGMDFGTCTTPAGTVVKSVTTMHKVAPALGAVFAVKFNNAVPAQARLNINGMTGYIQYRGGSIPNGVINAGDIATFMYYSGSGFNTFEILSVENGGNADTVGGKVPEKIFYDNGLSADLNGATQSGCYAASPDTLNVPFSTWWIVDTMNYNNQFIVQKAHTIGNTEVTVSYIRNYANDVWSDWKEISTTPIKSTGWLTSPTDSEGDIFFNLPTDTGRTYIAACSVGSIAILFSDGTNYRARIFDSNMKAVISMSVTYRLWYIEE